jgi:hypothetical protein
MRIAYASDDRTAVTDEVKAHIEATEIARLD